MCIIVYKKATIKKPSKKVLKICWVNNPDGAGFMYRKQGIDEICVHKGFMGFREFYSALQDADLSIDDEIAYHFRIGTSGKQDATATHPFPISDDIQMLRALDYRTNSAFAHNGILGKGDDILKLSDTQLFSINILSNLKPYLSDTKIQSTIANLTVGNRLIIWSSGTTIITGDWITEKTGLMYSNTGYLHEKNVYSPAYDTKDIKCPICLNFNVRHHHNDFNRCNDCGSLFSDSDTVYLLGDDDHDSDEGSSLIDDVSFNQF